MATLALQQVNEATTAYDARDYVKARRLFGLERRATSRFIASQQLREVTKCQRLGRFSFTIDRGISLNATPLSGPRLRNQRTVG